ncbi:MAG: hypothetical protein IJJ33_06155 [Victivallales bacterium]|nr:hypothetical protein [Victivallales bacterium]MBQ6471545.1 hypothetical protein [Victivallales bacterium]
MDWFEISNKRLSRRGPNVICINDRFVWHTEPYQGWCEFMRPDDKVCFIPYKGWTPELLVGHGDTFFEVWKNANPEELLQILEVSMTDKTPLAELFGLEDRTEPGNNGTPFLPGLFD